MGTAGSNRPFDQRLGAVATGLLQIRSGLLLVCYAEVRLLVPQTSATSPLDRGRPAGLARKVARCACRMANLVGSSASFGGTRFSDSGSGTSSHHAFDGRGGFEAPS